MLTVAGPTGNWVHHREGHPERPARIDAAISGIDDLHLDDGVRYVPARPAELGHLTRVHTTAYLDHLSAFCRDGGGDLDPDTYATADSWTAALLAAGAGLAAVESLRSTGDGAAFVVARPPGHHATADHQMGFCLLNNVAIAAAHLTDQGERVVVLDWDVHHGNGTQDVFWDDPAVLYVSTHQWGLYPGTGLPAEVGGPAAHGLTVNLPVPPGATGDVVRRAIEEVAGPVVEAFAPTWVLVSAGYDAHRADPLADLMLSAGDFAALARLAASFAPRPGRLALFLEGGYDLDALRHSVAATLGALATVAANAGEPETSGGPGKEFVDAVARVRSEAVGA